MNIFSKRLAARVAVYILGLLVLAFGVVFSINSDLGISPVNSIPFATSVVFEIRMGIIATTFFILCVVMQIIVLRKDFKVINLTQIFYSFIFGYFVDFARFVKADFAFPTYLGQLLMMVISIVLIATGLSLYLETKLVPMPSEGLVLAFVQKFPNLTFARAKVMLDSTLVVIAIVLTLVALGSVQGVREGTVLSAIFIGKLVPHTRKFVVLALDKVGFYPPPEPAPES